MQRNDFKPKSGEWVLDPKPCVHGGLPQKLATAFYDLFSNMDGAGYTPLVYCGHQIVNGTNYMIICKAVYITAKHKTAVVKVILHETIPTSGIFGEFSILSIETIVEEMPVGGYKLEPFAYIPGELSNDPIHTAFEQVLKNFDGSSIAPVAFCGTQLICADKTNNMFICKSSITKPGMESHIDTVILGKRITENGEAEYSLLSISEIL